MDDIKAGEVVLSGMLSEAVFPVFKIDAHQCAGRPEINSEEDIREKVIFEGHAEFAQAREQIEFADGREVEFPEPLAYAALRALPGLIASVLPDEGLISGSPPSCSRNGSSHVLLAPVWI
jgi:hypothetical protein